MRKKSNKVQYHCGDGIIEIVVRDHSGRKIDKFTVNQQDVKTQRIIGETLRDKYGIDFGPIVKSKPEGIFDY